MTAELLPVRPHLTLIQGGRGRPSKVRLASMSDAIEEQAAELAARRAEELGMAGSLRPVLRRMQIHARAAGPSAFRDVAALTYLLDRHARRWAEETDQAA